MINEVTNPVAGSAGTAQPVPDPPKAEAPALRLTSISLARFRDLALIPPIILVVVVGAFVSPSFLTRGNLTDVLVSMSWIGLLVLAEALVLLAGKMDLSLESTVGLAPGVAAWLTLPTGINHGLDLVPPGWAIPIALAVGVIIGAINAGLIVKLGLNAFIVTLGMLITLRGLLTGISGGQTFFGMTGSMMYLGTATWLGIPAAVWVCVVAYVIGGLGLRYLRSGRSLYAIGGNVDAARAAGIRTDRTLWWVFILASAIAALAGILLSGHLASVASSQGSGAIFTVFAAAVIGGVSLNGGRGSLVGAFTGILLLYLVQNVLTFAGVSGEWFDFLNGSVILAVLIITRVVAGRSRD
ncbi:ABC transporter permease [Cellulomonas sp. McL0617]|uniref:ABC transporter permease n=1 Tax=Cellulomonas sp. McL0617 TaxID=3415675 RepID=UPI003CF3CFB4